ncbi:serine protease snake-like isoform X2 [Zophobas morio]|uniref:serine protease snake-like isoform X2 n=1 Tax=Zophobas morio TaxID=2755281 RepID=UPI003082FE0A
MSCILQCTFNSKEMHKFLIVVIMTLVKNAYTESIVGPPCILNSSNTHGRCLVPHICRMFEEVPGPGKKLPKYTYCDEKVSEIFLICCPEIYQPGYITENKCREYASLTKEKQLCRHSVRPGGTANFPHIALLGYPDRENWLQNQWLCMGALISEQYVLTEAHCISHRSEYNVSEPTVVLLGIANGDDTTHRQEIKVSKTILHQDPSKKQEIALVKLEKPIEMSSYVRPACLKAYVDIPVTKVFVTEWHLRRAARVISKELIEVTVDVLREPCNNGSTSPYAQDFHFCTSPHRHGIFRIVLVVHCIYFTITTRPRVCTT